MKEIHENCRFLWFRVIPMRLGRIPSLRTLCISLCFQWSGRISCITAWRSMRIPLFCEIPWKIMKFIKNHGILDFSWNFMKFMKFKENSQFPRIWGSKPLKFLRNYSCFCDARYFAKKWNLRGKRKNHRKMEFLIFLRNSAKLVFFVKNGSEDARGPQKAWNAIRFTVIWACRPRGCENMKIMRKIKNVFAFFHGNVVIIKNLENSKNFMI